MRPAGEVDWAAFTTYVWAQEAAEVATPAEFKGGLVLEGYTRKTGSPGRIVTYWHTTAPLPESYKLVLYFTQEDGALVWAYDEGTPTESWFPTNVWPAGKCIRAVFPPLEIGQFTSALVGVVREGGDAWSAAGRLPIVESEGRTLDDSTLIHLFDIR